MKIEYIRNMQFGYMRMELSMPLTKTEEAMLANNAIEGLLPVCWQQENDRYLLRYDITGKQALDGVLEQAMADEKLLRNLLVGICVTFKQLEKYLLPQEGLLLTPETIFYDGKTETMHFCYYPENKDALQKQLVKLMEFILAKTDHKNIAAVQMTYGVYEEVQNPLFCMEDLQVYMQEKNVLIQQKDLLIDDVTPEEPYYEPERQVKKESNKWDRFKTKWVEAGLVWINEKMRKFLKQPKQEAMVVFDTDGEIEEDGATTILGGVTDRIEGILKYEGTNNLPDIPVTKIPFIIGSAASCDGMIRHPNISRNHVKITYREGTYFIEDLNSTNGTRVNGGLLSYKTKVSIKKNVSIHLANEPFRFV